MAKTVINWIIAIVSCNSASGPHVMCHSVIECFLCITCLCFFARPSVMPCPVVVRAVPELRTALVILKTSENRWEYGWPAPCIVEVDNTATGKST